MKIIDAQLETVCGIKSSLPENLFTEIAFAGKSNVGKSSLINGLMNRKSLARTSSQPGKTQTINYYHIKYRPEAEEQPEEKAMPKKKNDKEIYFVDLPGYGFAKVPEKERVAWGKMIEGYLYQSKQLKTVFLLIDIRHDPSGNDKMMYDWIQSRGYEPVIIATKRDKLKKSQVQRQISAIKKGLKMPSQSKIFPYSSVTKEGREEIWDYIFHQEQGGLSEENGQEQIGLENELQ